MNYEVKTTILSTLKNFKQKESLNINFRAIAKSLLLRLHSWKLSGKPHTSHRMPTQSRGFKYSSNSASALPDSG